MAYREVEMWEILDVLRRIGRGESKTAIRRATGHARKTIRRYLERACKLDWNPGGGVEPDEALALEVARSLKPVGRTAYAVSSEFRLGAQREQICQWLFPQDGSRGLRLSKVHELLGRLGVEVPYTSLHRFAVKHCDFHERKRITVRVAEVEPGELAEVDFGRLGLVADPATGRRQVHALIVTLVYSRHQYVHVTFSQKLPDLIEGLEDAWEHLGGVTARVVLDNLHAAVVKPDRYDPIFQRTFEEYARHRGFVIHAAVVRHATGKPHVERQVQYVRESFFRGEDWHDIAQVQREVIRWSTEVAGQRIHGTLCEKPIARFEAEKTALRPFEAPRDQRQAFHPEGSHSLQ